MQLRWKFTCDEVLIYREKWGTLAFAAIAGAGCLAFSIWFYWLMRTPATLMSPFLILFCATFGVFGAVVLFRLPGHARQVLKDKGAKLFVANPSGLTLTPNLGTEAKYLAWPAVAELVLAEKLRIVDSDETAFLSRAIIVFQPTGMHASATWLDRVKSGVAKSGEGRPYFLAQYPRGQGPAVAAALRALVPAPVQVRLRQRVVFDTRAGADTYAGA